MDEEKIKKAARIIIKAGMLPFPVTDTLVEIMELLYVEDELDFIIKAFRRKASLSMDELTKFTKMTEDDILPIVDGLAKKGALFTSTSSSGMKLYRVLPLIMVGIFEYTYMKKIEFTEEEKKIAVLFKKLFNEVRDTIQDKYDMMIPMFKQLPPVDRTIPVYENVDGKEITVEINEALDAPVEEVLPMQKIEEIINKFDDIAVGHCFCRHHKDLLDEPCEIHASRENCFTFGKSARFTVEQGFARMISKEEALKIVKETEEQGLVHKVYHPFGNTARDETSLCNCCKCCCGTFELWKNGVIPMVNASNFIAFTDTDLCTGCGTCVEKCPVDAIELNDSNKSERNEEWCIGCGTCAHFCPEGAISLKEKQRTVYVPPPKLRQ